jgi:hypothetical protein
MTYDNEAIVRHAYHAAEGNVLDVAGFVGSFAEDGVFNNVVGQESYRGEHIGDLVLGMAKMIPGIMFAQMGVMPDFASAVAAPVAAR